MPSVLVVDDDRLVLKLSKLLFEREGYQTRLVDRGEEVTDDDARWADLAVVDLHIGHASGLELVRRLRTAHPALRIIGWSADDTGPEMTEWQLACDRFVLKPFDVRELLAIADALLRGHRDRAPRAV